eukprot:CCRYP_009135-RA/>CCRYP_009135-RA protein AED:0.38 eAED:0.46 QI:0/0.25/0.2/1/0/0/5/85/141
MARKPMTSLAGAHHHASLERKSSDVIMEGSVRNTLKVSIEEYGVDIVNRLAAGLELGIVVVESQLAEVGPECGEVVKATVAVGGAAAAGGAWLPPMALARLATTARKRVIFFWSSRGVDWLCRASPSVGSNFSVYGGNDVE